MNKLNDAGASPPSVDNSGHDWREEGVDTHKGAYWYRCLRCGASDWIASYGTQDQMMPPECSPRPNV